MSHLHVRWARFFTLAGWSWKLAAPYSGFDFHVTMPCLNSECHGAHTLSVRICERSREALERLHYEMFSVDDMYGSRHAALFGNGPRNTVWQMCHGSGGGEYHVDEWSVDAKSLWERSGHE